MKKQGRYKNVRNKKVKRAKVTILFAFIVLFVVCITSLIAIKILDDGQEVQALDVNNTNYPNSENNINEMFNSKNNDLDTDDRKEINYGSDAPGNKSEVEDVAFLENYLNKEMKGEKHDKSDGKKVAYLTFDDGPSVTVTPKILDILKQENIHATFFLVGKAIDDNSTAKNLVKREAAEGHSIANHTYSHNYNYLYPNKKVSLNNFMSEVEKTNQSLKRVLGNDFSTRVIRLPGGRMTWNVNDSDGMSKLDKTLHDKDYHEIDWNSLSKDAEGQRKNAEQLKQEVIKSVVGKEKVVILMHDTYGKEETAKALPDIIKYLKEEGYEFKIIR
ncbi:polysaccharide deacetylase family protein [Clostridium chromiireducens]|uniref:polysaccharide deacetylase family protein n=1 Tax=Clostridium chromiireducens TaxID=225345 RepID=UPI003AF8941D